MANSATEMRGIECVRGHEVADLETVLSLINDEDWEHISAMIDSGFLTEALKVFLTCSKTRISSS